MTNNKSMLTELLADIQQSGLSYFAPSKVPNEKVAEYLNKHDVIVLQHGFWKKHSLNHHKCSYCHNVTNTYFGCPKYCPECGAKMNVERIN